MREREGENLKERGDRSAATTSLSLWFFPSHSRPAPSKNNLRTNDKERMTEVNKLSNSSKRRRKPLDHWMRTLPANLDLS